MGRLILEGNIVDVLEKRIFAGRIISEQGRIVSVEKTDKPVKTYILPGFIDAHVHIESSMLVPSEFSRIAARHGTVYCISDPHEIANVLGIDGVRFMIEDSKRAKVKFLFGAPSCVPATDFETSGSRINIRELEELLEWEGIGFLSEMMNYPGVLSNDREVLGKIRAAKDRNKLIDGHAPGLKGKDLDTYIKAGISSDHECTDLEEAIEKIEKGMKILIREGSAAKNLSSLVSLVDRYPESVMFCTDDMHPDDLIEGHMNRIFRRAVESGCDWFNVLRAMTLNPKDHYGLDSGLLQKGDTADFIEINNLGDMEIMATYINGETAYIKGMPESGKTLEGIRPNRFECRAISSGDLSVKAEKEYIRVICAADGELVTGCEITRARVEDNVVKTSVDQDVLKIVVHNRYTEAEPVTGFVKGFGLKRGAIASSIAHDSHNIICVGENDQDIAAAINYIVEKKGGIAAADRDRIDGMALPVAGIMSDQRGETVAEQYRHMNLLSAKLGSPLKSPFMTLSFMALLVIPELKIGDKGLFDVNKFSHTSLFV